MTTTYFKPGDVLVSSSSSQGLRMGARYVVRDLHERCTFAGNFVTYVVAPVDAPDAHVCVRNAHLLLSRVS